MKHIFAIWQFVNFRLWIFFLKMTQLALKIVGNVFAEIVNHPRKIKLWVTFWVILEDIGRFFQRIIWSPRTLFTPEKLGSVISNPW
jgi:hypothetical protein